MLHVPPLQSFLLLFIITHTKKVQTVTARTMSFSPPSHESHLPPNTPNIYFDNRNARDHALRCATKSNAAAACLSISVRYTNSRKLQRQQIGYLEAKIFLWPVCTPFSNVSKLRSRRQISNTVTTGLTYSSLSVNINITGTFSHFLYRASWYTCLIQTDKLHFSS
jgi:hypothetical protein